MSIHSVQMVMSGIKQLQRATITQRPANTCFLLKQKQPDQPLCIWVVTAGSSLRLLPQTGTGRNATSFPLLSFSPYTNTHTHCLFPLVSPDQRAPQTVFIPPQAAGPQPSSLFMNQVQLKYNWTKDRRFAHADTTTGSRVCSSCYRYPHGHLIPHFKSGQWVPAQRGLYNALITAIASLWYDTW